MPVVEKCLILFTAAKGVFILRNQHSGRAAPRLCTKVTFIGTF
jgi:hypothetical protein